MYIVMYFKIYIYTTKITRNWHAKQNIKLLKKLVAHSNKHCNSYTERKSFF